MLGQLQILSTVATYTVQGRIFPKIQPTTIYQIDLTSDKNKVKTQLSSGLSTK